MIIDKDFPDTPYCYDNIYYRGVCCVKSKDNFSFVNVVANRPGVFVDSAIFERVSHFHDQGIPGTLKDPFNRAAIADATCRSVGVNREGSAYFGYLETTDNVINAMNALPSTAGPSMFTLAAKKNLVAPCTFIGSPPKR